MWKVSGFDSAWNDAAVVLDLCLWLTSLLFNVAMSELLACSMPPPPVVHSPSQRIRSIVLFPVFLLAALALAVPAISGFVLWTVVAIAFRRGDCVTWFNGSAPVAAAATAPNSFTFVTANVLLGPNAISSMQNMKHPIGRLAAMGSKFQLINKASPSSGGGGGGDCDKLGGPALCSKVKRSLSVDVDWPANVDFLCLQEVWERWDVLFIFRKLLNSSFVHFVGDGNQNWSNSRFPYRSNGLLVASRYPVSKTETVFLPPGRTASYQSVLASSFVMIKVELGGSRVGFLCNLHLPAFESESTRACHPLTRLQTDFDRFQKDNFRPDDGEKKLFAVMCGDFNLCNVSPCNRSSHDHPIFHRYGDYARLGPGRDRSWTVGTELRQLHVGDERVATPEAMRRVMNDDRLRSRHVIDADLESVGFNVSFRPVRPNVPSDVQGRRRVDRILVDNVDVDNRIIDYKFLTTLANNTDHLAVALTIATD